MFSSRSTLQQECQKGADVQTSFKIARLSLTVKLCCKAKKENNVLSSDFMFSPTKQQKHSNCSADV